MLSQKCCLKVGKGLQNTKKKLTVDYQSLFALNFFIEFYLKFFFTLLRQYYDLKYK